MKKLIALAVLAISLNASAQTDSTKPNKRPIDKVKVWVNGVTYDADDIDVVCVWDDLATTARFYYTLSDSTGAVVTSGNVELTGQKYKFSSCRKWRYWWRRCWWKRRSWHSWNCKFWRWGNLS